MQIINFLYPEKSEIKYRIDTYPDSQSHLVLESEMDRRKSLLIYTRLSNLNDIWILMQLADICHRQGIQISHLQIVYLFAARTDRLFSFNEALDLELVGKCLTFVQAQITSVIEPHSSRLISDGIILPNLTESAKVLPNNIHGAVLFPDKGAQKRYEDYFMFESIYCAEKHRVSKDKLEVIITSEIDSSKSITVVDDLCDGGGTFFAIHKALQDKGAKDISLCVVHAIQKEPLIKLAQLYKTITISNSYKDWDKEELPNNIIVKKVYE
jgi:ribose-phosphate pyrophosphokinase